MKTQLERNPTLKNTICSWWASHENGDMDYLLIAPFVHGAAMATPNSNPDLIDDLFCLMEVLKIKDKLK